MPLTIGKNGFSLPIELVTSTQAILARKRSGKSYTASVQAEELLRHKQQIAAINPTGAWRGLRSSQPGTVLLAERPHDSSFPICRSISSQTMRTNSTQSRTCYRIGTVLALMYRCCRSRKAAIRQAFSNHQSLGGCLSPGDVMGSLIGGS